MLNVNKEDGISKYKHIFCYIEKYIKPHNITITSSKGSHDYMVKTIV